MTAFDRFDHRLAASLEDLAAPTYPDYFDDALEKATRRAQRPSWTFLERWLPMSTVTRRTVFAPVFPYRTVMILLALLAILIAAMAIAIGSRPELKPAPPFGPAANGAIVYTVNGDLYTRDTLLGTERLLLGGPEFDVYPFFSRDGTKLAFFRATGPGTDDGAVMVANADGSDVRMLFPREVIYGAAWSPDSTELAMIMERDGRPTLQIVGLEQGAVPRVIDLPVRPTGEFDWRPPDGREIIFRGEQGALVAIYAVKPDGSDVRQITPKRNFADHYWGAYAFSPDGHEMAYGDGGERVDVHILNLDTGADRLWGEAMPPPEPGYTGPTHWGSPVYSADGKRFVFGRYWDEHDGTINHQVWVATIASDGADAVPVGEVHRSQSGENPFLYAFAPDDTTIVIQDNDIRQTWMANPTGGEPQALDWGDVLDPPTWQRLAR